MSRPILVPAEIPPIAMPRAHRVASQLDRWWLGIHQGAIRPAHLAYYLDEFTFRFDHRTSKARGLLFYRLAQLATDCQPMARKELLEGKHNLWERVE